MAADLSQSSLNLSAEEKRLYGQLFQQADTDGLGVVTGDVAVKFFERTRLDPQVLGAIWQIGDLENRGLLTPAGFSVVLRLIGHAQAGRQPTEALARQTGPLPRFDGIELGTVQPQTTGTQVPRLTPEKAQEYAVLFQKAGGQGGLLGGDTAKSVFERARLPNEVLGQIWTLSDTKQRGALDVADFVIAMHLITSLRSGNMRALPAALPSGLYEAAAGASRRAPAPAPAPAPVAAAIPQQFSGSMGAQSPRQFGSPPVSAQATGADWLVTPMDHAKFRQIFASIDTAGTGLISGDQAVPFFSNSGLPEDVLASIWDLADINSEGQLNVDEFAVAMYLIRQQRARRPGDGRGDLPSTLPPRLIPPSMRQQTAPPSLPTAPAFDNAAHATPQPKSAADDLFGLDALTAEPAPATKAADPFGNQPGSPTSPRAPAQPLANRGPPGSFKPFIPQSSFGQGIAVHNTGGSIGSTGSQPRAAVPGQAAAPFPVPAAAPAQTALATVNDDLLGDNDPEVSSKLTSETAELANMSNQIGTLRNQMQDVQNKKTATERDLNASSAQKKDLEARLAQFRTQYEQQIREVKSLEERLSASKSETQKLQQECAMVEGAHADLQTQYQQLSTALEADQRENESLKERMQQLNGEIAQLKPQVEKLKADSRQQKGMVAINKKQVATNEAEKERLQKEKTDLEAAPHAEPEVHTPAAHVEAERSLPSTTTSPPVTSPGGTNPFFRSSPQASFDSSMAPAAFGAAVGAAGGAVAATAAHGHSDNAHSAFDSFFGTSGNSSEISAPPPTTFADRTEAVSSDTPRASTPLTSPPSTAPETPQTGLEPPAPPTSRQITPSVLPLRKELDRTESYSSSTRANPPASRSGLSDVGSHLESGGATPTGASAHGPTAEDKNHSEDMPGAFPGDESVIPTPTGGPENTDFDSAFASFDQPDAKADSKTLDFPEIPASTATAKSTGGPASTSKNTEFPPIEDLDQDEDDDSTASEGGFDDDFAPAASKPTAATVDGSTSADVKGKGVAIEHAPPPPANASSSPPPYTSEGHAHEHRDSNQFPQQYSGLLASREMASSPPDEVIQSTPVTIASPEPHDVSKPIPTTNGAAAKPKSEVETATSRPAAKVDDFDSAFDDLDEAKEETDPEFGTAATSREDGEFNPTFGSPAPSRTGTAHDMATPSKPGHPSSAAASSFANFEPSFGAATQSFYGGPEQAQQQGASNHDWDAIFSGLDKAPDLDASAKSPFDVDEAAPAAVQPPAPAAAAAAAASSSTMTTTKVSAKPALGRAISQGTEHDDPILKSLTGMGYARDKALKALERYDYNLDKAADHLASHS